MEREDKILIVGYGSVGRRHARNLRQLGCRNLLNDPEVCFRLAVGEHRVNNIEVAADFIAILLLRWDEFRIGLDHNKWVNWNFSPLRSRLNFLSHHLNRQCIAAARFLQVTSLPESSSAEADPSC